jgi:3-oxoacyl-(acyl-carrier-protein) synthase
MSDGVRVFVTGLGAVCSGANDVPALRTLLTTPKRRFRGATVFPAKGACADLPVAEVDGMHGSGELGLPRTHRLALQAAREAIGDGPPPDAILIGTTTGGILTTEDALRAGATDPGRYRFHGLGTVAQTLAEHLTVAGPALTVSTACSSAAVAIAVAHALLRAGIVRRVLAGGADSLSRLTFHGFRQLQLVAPEGCRPLDLDRAGMTVGEGAGFLLLESAPAAGTRRFAELRGTGLSCDAYHATSPHPEGVGAVLAIRSALADAGLEAAAIGYVNLHGTGTMDNDAAEALALRQVFGQKLPPLSSTKGLIGHTLAAAGAIEAVISVIALDEGLLPANSGLVTVDPKLELLPIVEPTRASVDAVLSNSFGFGGNNACLVFSRPAAEVAAVPPQPHLPAVRIASVACLTARGALDETMAALAAAEDVAGLVPDSALANAGPATFIRRLKRLPRLMLALANAARAAASATAPPAYIAAATSWGPLAETQDFLRKLFDTDDQFSSPTDFVGSVNNAPAGQVALLLSARAPNLTFSSGERSFAQAVLAASLGIEAGAENALVLAAEAYESRLSPLLDPASAATPSDGGAAFVLLPDDELPGPRMRWLAEVATEDALSSLLQGIDAMAGEGRFDAIALGIPAAFAEAARPLVSELAARCPTCPIVPYRMRLGQHASAGATAAAVIAHGLFAGTSPLAGVPASSKRALLLELGQRSTALEVFV